MRGAWRQQPDEPRPMKDSREKKLKPAPRQRAALSFLLGMGSVLDLFGTDPPPPRRLVRYRNAAEALGRDWQAVGADLRRVLRRFSDNPRLLHGQR